MLIFLVCVLNYHLIYWQGPWKHISEVIRLNISIWPSSSFFLESDKGHIFDQRHKHHHLTSVCWVNGSSLEHWVKLKTFVIYRLFLLIRSSTSASINRFYPLIRFDRPVPQATRLDLSGPPKKSLSLIKSWRDRKSVDIKDWRQLRLPGCISPGADHSLVFRTWSNLRTSSSPWRQQNFFSGIIDVAVVSCWHSELLTSFFT